MTAALAGGALLCWPLRPSAQTGSGNPEPYLLKIDWEEEKVGVKQKCFTIEVSDSTDHQFAPSLEITAFDGECRFRINLSTAEHSLAAALRTVSESDGKAGVRFSTSTQVHEIKARGDTAFEWDLILYERPDTNVFTYSIETEGIRFFRQPALTPEDIAAGAEMPENEAGGYAMYHATRRDNWTYKDRQGKILYREEYKTGAVGFIYRPRAWDSAGDTIWCDHVIDLNAATYSNTVPQDFLDRAVYPVTIDPHFGNEAGSGSTTLSNNAWGISDVTYQHTAGAGETVDSICVYGKGYLGAWSIDGAIYTVGASNRPVTKIGSSVTMSSSSSTGVWVCGTASIALTNGTTYTLAIGDDVNTARFYYNAETDGDCSRQTVNNDLAATWTHGLNSTYVPRLYAVYTVSGGEPEPSPRRRLMDRGPE